MLCPFVLPPSIPQNSDNRFTFVQKAFLVGLFSEGRAKIGSKWVGQKTV